ncbi:hypothetical protein PG996_011721 [Apiospora saccharicola]|uniref:Uncharacterized protein n=1 Tax=Apiospora saccharicola TaxID=335842 RepID=A0ABR1UIU2_9PEZI
MPRGPVHLETEDTVGDKHPLTAPPRNTLVLGSNAVAVRTRRTFRDPHLSYVTILIKEKTKDLTFLSPCPLQQAKLGIEPQGDEDGNEEEADCVDCNHGIASVGWVAEVLHFTRRMIHRRGIGGSSAMFLLVAASSLSVIVEMHQARSPV